MTPKEYISYIFCRLYLTRPIYIMETVDTWPEYRTICTGFDKNCTAFIKNDFTKTGLFVMDLLKLCNVIAKMTHPGM